MRSFQPLVSRLEIVLERNTDRSDYLWMVKKKRKKKKNWTPVSHDIRRIIDFSILLSRNGPGRLKTQESRRLGRRKQYIHVRTREKIATNLRLSLCLKSLFTNCIEYTCNLPRKSASYFLIERGQRLCGYGENLISKSSTSSQKLVHKIITDVLWNQPASRLKSKLEILYKRKKRKKMRYSSVTFIRTTKFDFSKMETSDKSRRWARELLYNTLPGRG